MILKTKFRKTSNHSAYNSNLKQKKKEKFIRFAKIDFKNKPKTLSRDLFPFKQPEYLRRKRKKKPNPHSTASHTNKAKRKANQLQQTMLLENK